VKATQVPVGASRAHAHDNEADEPAAGTRFARPGRDGRSLLHACRRLGQRQRAEGADLDNLCEPVFAVLANRLGWFGGRRPNVRAFWARKALAEPTGCRIRITDSRWAETSPNGDVLLDGTYMDELPRSARDENFAAWVSRTMSRPARSLGELTVELGFAGPVNLGDIATGRLKNVIDCLYPLIGGRPGAPNDSRITVIEATRMHREVAAGVRVRVTEGPN